MELRGIESEIRGGSTERAAIAAEIERLYAERQRLTASLVTQSARVRASETALQAADETLQIHQRREEAIRRSLAARRLVVTEVLAALQRMGRRPPPAVLVRPDDMLQAIRASMLMGAVVPELKAEADALAIDLADLVAVRETIATQRRALAQQQAALTDERDQLAARVSERQASLQMNETKLVEQRQRTLALSRQAQSLKELIARMDSEIAATRRAQEAMNAALASPGGLLSMAALTPGGLRDLARLQPKMPFQEARGSLSLPVNGNLTKGFGSTDGFGGQERGITLSTRPDALVTMPMDGTVAFAGPHRAYGQVLIINAGLGYHVTLAGMERLNVETGQFILAGEPIGVMGREAAGALAETDGGKAVPALYIEFRKDGSPIDPNPWWAKSPERSEHEKARG